MVDLMATDSLEGCCLPELLDIDWPRPPEGWLAESAVMAGSAAYVASLAAEAATKIARTTALHIADLTPVAQGWLLREVQNRKGQSPLSSNGQALSAATELDLVLDSGATGHFVKPNAKLTNVRPTSKSVQGASGDVMRGLQEGDLGQLNGVMRVQGLQQSLLSVSKLTSQHDVCVVFTAQEAYIIPRRHLMSELAIAGPAVASRDRAGLYRTTPTKLDAGLNRVRARPDAKRKLRFQRKEKLGRGSALQLLANASGMSYPLGRPNLKRHRSEPTPRHSALAGDELQVLILATSGDMALASIVADRTGVNMNRVRQDMERSPRHWAHEAAEYSLLTCNECGRPGWPDCVCGQVGVQEEDVEDRSKILSAYNYMDQPAENPAVLFHRRLGHLPIPRMLAAFKEGDPGIQGLTEESIKAMPWCPQCAACKSTRKGHPRVAKGRKRTQTINAVIHTDTMERIVPSMAPGRHTRIQTFVDEATRYIWVEYFSDKKAETFMHVLEKFETRAQIQHRTSVQWKGDAGTPVLSYFSDSAGELCGRRSKARLANKGIELRLSVPHESQTNGIAERANRTLLDTTRILLHQAGLPLPFWALAMDMAVWLVNRAPTKSLSGSRSPYEAYHGTKPNRDKHARVRVEVLGVDPQGEAQTKIKADAHCQGNAIRRLQRHGLQGFQSLGSHHQEGEGAP